MTECGVCLYETACRAPGDGGIPTATCPRGWNRSSPSGQIHCTRSRAVRTAGHCPLIFALGIIAGDRWLPMPRGPPRRFAGVTPLLGGEATCAGRSNDRQAVDGSSARCCRGVGHCFRHFVLSPIGFSNCRRVVATAPAVVARSCWVL